MPASDDHPTIKNLGTIYEPRGDGLRYMRRRRIGTADRNGDPLDGLVNLFDVALVLAVGFLVAALSAAGLSWPSDQREHDHRHQSRHAADAGHREGGRPDREARHDERRPGPGARHARRFLLQAGRRHRRLRACRGAATRELATPVPGASPSPARPRRPRPTTTDYPTTNPYATPSPLPTAPPPTRLPTAPPTTQPTPGVTLTPAD